MDPGECGGSSFIHLKVHWRSQEWPIVALAPIDEPLAIPVI